MSLEQLLLWFPIDCPRFFWLFTNRYIFLGFLLVPITLYWNFSCSHASSIYSILCCIYQSNCTWNIMMHAHVIMESHSYDIHDHKIKIEYSFFPNLSRWYVSFSSQIFIFIHAFNYRHRGGLQVVKKRLRYSSFFVFLLYINTGKSNILFFCPTLISNRDHFVVWGV